MKNEKKNKIKVERKKKKGKWKEEDWIEKRKKLFIICSIFSLIYIFLSFWLFCDFLYFVLFFNNRPFIKKNCPISSEKYLYAIFLLFLKRVKIGLGHLKEFESLLCRQKSLATQKARESITKKMLCWQNKRTSKRRGKRSMEYIVSR
jgi:hypothetical protein